MAILVMTSCGDLQSSAQIAGRQAQFNQVSGGAGGQSGLQTQSQPEDELRTGTSLSRRGLFKDAIPHLLAARGRVSNEYAAEFNLALCYVGIRDFEHAITVLEGLRDHNHDNADLENLLAQAYIGSGQMEPAFAAAQKAATLAPENEKLYLFVADACMESGDYFLGLKVVGLGLQHLPRSAQLHYERAMLLLQLDEPDQAKAEFQTVAKLVPESEYAYLASAHEALFEGNIPEAVRLARDGVAKHFANPVLLTLLGEALLRSGVTPGQPAFLEAQQALEKSARDRPNDAESQIALGRLNLMAHRLDDAIAHLEAARALKPDEPSIYANLAKAYQRRGESQKAQEALKVLAELNQAQAEKIRSAPGDRKASYGATNIDPTSALQK